MAKPVDTQASPCQQAAERGFSRLPRLVLLALAVLCQAVPAAARSPLLRTPEPVTRGEVRAVIDGDTVALETGVEVRLVGIQAPKLALGRPGFKDWPLAAEAKETLSRLALGKPVTLWYGGRKSDRHGRLLAHLTVSDGSWIQGEMLRRGMARVYTFADNRARAAEMLAAEQDARSLRRGIWRHPYYRVRDPGEAGRFTDTFQLVEGTVMEAAVVRGRGYLNFGENWRTDFTVSVAPKALRRYWGEEQPFSAYDGRRVRVRGWLRSYNGPLIDATHPEQIELLP